MTKHFVIGNKFARLQTVLMWDIMNDAKALAEKAQYLEPHMYAAKAAYAFQGHAVETSEGDIVMTDVYDEPTHIFVRMGGQQWGETPQVVPNHAYLVFVNCGETYELHLLPGEAIPRTFNKECFEMMALDPQRF